MYKAYKLRLYPNSFQKQMLSKTFGCVRLIYNHFLDKCKKNGYIKAFDMCAEVKELYSEYPFLKEVDSCSLRCAIFNLEDAFKNFFLSVVIILNLKASIISRAIKLHVLEVNIRIENTVI